MVVVVMIIMVVMVAMVVLVNMVITVIMVIVVIRQKRQIREDRQVWHINLIFQVTCEGHFFRSSCDVFNSFLYLDIMLPS